MISPDPQYPNKRRIIDGSAMAYVETGTGDPIVFLHGNPTSSYLWRNVIPHLEPLGRCIAPDLIGMGDSDKLVPSGPERYTFTEHRRYLDGLLAALGVGQRVCFVLHDWGAALGFDWARRHPGAVRAIAYMEAIVQPNRSWNDWPKTIRALFQALRSPAGEAMVLEQNLFVEQLLPGAVLRPLSEQEMNHYRAPYRTPGESRRPTLTWPRQIPIGGKPADVHQIVAQSGAWMAASEVPKLFIQGRPGAILTGEHAAFCRTWPNQTEVSVAGVHFLQEDSPDEIGQAIASWLDGQLG